MPRRSDSGVGRESDTEGTATTQSDPIDDPEVSHPVVRMAPGPVTTPVPVDEVFALLRKERRRRVLYYLADHEEETGPVLLSDLAEQIAAWEHDKPITQLHSDERKNVYVALYDIHLPKMADLGAVTYNQSRGLIEPGEHFETYLWYLARTRQPDVTVTESWPHYYGALSVLAVAGLGAAMWFDPHTTVPLVELMVAGIVAAFGSCTGWYLWSDQRAAETGTTATT